MSDQPNPEDLELAGEIRRHLVAMVAAIERRYRIARICTVCAGCDRCERLHAQADDVRYTVKDRVRPTGRFQN